jgi:uncharacterized membrane protein HdeD (DUF308 family)
MMTTMNVLAFIVSFALFIGGIFLMGQAFSVEDAQGFVFFAGIAVTSLGVALPIHVLKRIDA